MALDHTSLFENIGEYLEAIRGFRTLFTTLDGYEAEITNELEENADYQSLDGVHGLFVGFKDQIVGWCDSLSGQIENLLMDRDTVLNQVPGVGPNPTIDTLLSAFIRHSKEYQLTVLESTVTVSSPAASSRPDGSANIGDVTILADKVLDGFSEPGDGMSAHPEYAGLNSQLTVNTTETVTVTCTSDSESDGLTAGSENWVITGRASNNGPFDWREEGSGETTMQTLNANQIILNGEFEDFTVSNTPDNWTLNTGSAGTHYQRESSIIKRGTYAFSFLGVTAFTDHNVSQTLAAGSVTPLQKYCLAVWVRGSAGVLAGDLTIQFEGTGYTAASTEKITMDTAALAAQVSYGLKYFYIVMPSVIPDDLKIVIKMENSLTNAVPVRFDGLCFGPVTWYGGVSVVAIGGATNAIRGDRYDFTIANDGAGYFQDYFRRKYKIQLPSSATPSAANSLVTD